MFRLPLTDSVNHFLTGSLQGFEPIQSNISASFTSWTNKIPYDSQEEVYYYDAITIGNDTLDDNKIRIEENKLIAPLSIDNRAEQSQYDTAPKDSPKLGIFYSPQTIINDDIIAQLGRINLEDYIGDPIDYNSRDYSVLEKFANNYWQKYSDKSNLNDFLSMFKLFDLTFFKQIDQLIPARAEKIIGLLLQPTLLERSKDSTDTGYFEKFDESYESEIDLVDSEKNINASIEELSDNILVNDDKNEIIDVSTMGQLVAYFTQSIGPSYDSMTYERTSVERVNGTWVEYKSPYWLSEPLCPTITSSPVSKKYQYKFISSSFTALPSTFGTATYGASTYGGLPIQIPLIHFSYSFAEIQDYNFDNNNMHKGTQLIGSDFNVPPVFPFSKTIDGGPVVEFTDTNPNKIKLSQPGAQGAFVVEKLKPTKKKRKNGKYGEEPRPFEK